MSEKSIYAPEIVELTYKLSQVTEMANLIHYILKKDRKNINIDDLNLALMELHIHTEIACYTGYHFIHNIKKERQSLYR